MRLHARLREAVAATELPQLQRGTSKPIEESLDRDNAAYQQGLHDHHNGRPQLSRKQFNAQHPGHDADDYPLYQAGYAADRDDLKLEPKDKPARESLRLLIREAAPTKKGGAYEVTIVREGPGNPSDRNYYTRDALREAVRRGLFEGLQAYLNHPTASEERERPERDVRYLAGHFREARYIDGNPAEVRAKFIPGGMDTDGVINLIEAALESVPGRPLVGISIDGYGHAPDQQDINGRTYNMVREVTHLGSADIVTRAGAGGMFHRRLQEAWRTQTPAAQAGDTSKEVRMKPAKLQEKLTAAVAKLREASSIDGDDERADTLVTEALDTLTKLSEAKLSTKQRKKLPKSDFAIPSKAPGSGSYPDEDASHARDALARVDADGTPAEKAEVRRAVKKKYPNMKVGGSKKSREADTGDAAMAKDAELTQLREALSKAERKINKLEGRVSEYERRDLAAEVLREADVDPKLARIWAPDLLAEETKKDMVALVERKREELDVQAERLRESLGGIEGAGPRQPLVPADSHSTGDLLARLKIDRDELAA